jgi:hypothetical protein
MRELRSHELADLYCAVELIALDEHVHPTHQIGNCANYSVENESPLVLATAY